MSCSLRSGYCDMLGQNTVFLISTKLISILLRQSWYILSLYTVIYGGKPSNVIIGRSHICPLCKKIQNLETINLKWKASQVVRRMSRKVHQKRESNDSNGSIQQYSTHCVTLTPHCVPLTVYLSLCAFHVNVCYSSHCAARCEGHLNKLKLRIPRSEAHMHGGGYGSPATGAWGVGGCRVMRARMRVAGY